MTRFADELRGSEGERCLVIDVRRDELLRPAEIVRAAKDGTTVDVQYDDGTTATVAYTLVRLIDDEKP